MPLSVCTICYVQRYYRRVLTSSETVVPPIGLAEIRFQVIGSPCDDDDGRRNQRSYAKEHAERQDDDTEPLQQARVRYLHGLRRLHSEDHGYPENVTSFFFIRIHSFRLLTIHELLDWSTNSRIFMIR